VKIKSIKAYLDVSDPDLLYEVNLYDPDNRSFGGSDLSATTTFSDIDYTIPEGARKTFTIKAKFNPLSGNYAEGSTVKVVINASSSTIDAEDSSYNTATVDQANITGYTQYAMTSDVYFKFEGRGSYLVGSDESKIQSDSMRFSVKAGKKDIYLLAGAVSSSTPNAPYGVFVTPVVNPTTSTTTIETLTLNRISGGELLPSGNYRISADNTAVFEVSYSINNTGRAANTAVMPKITGFGWNTSDSSTGYRLYTYNLDDFKVGPYNLLTENVQN
jgi:hypothetical protein